jgi:HSP90 family molecular chaperone
MRRVLAAAGQKAPDSKPVLELNGTHSIVKYLDGERAPAQVAQLAELLYDQAALRRAACEPRELRAAPEPPADQACGSARGDMITP